MLAAHEAISHAEPLVAARIMTIARSRQIGPMLTWGVTKLSYLSSAKARERTALAPVEFIYHRPATAKYVTTMTGELRQVAIDIPLTYHAQRHDRISSLSSRASWPQRF